jgi:lysyl-tRNA synthetase class 2
MRSGERYPPLSANLISHSVGQLGQLRAQRALEPLVGLRITTAGRVMNVRTHSQVVFVDLFENSSIFQVMLTSSAAASIGRGDIVVVEGELTRTMRGDYAVKASRIQVLAPIRRQIPQPSPLSEETRMRDRVLALMLDPEVRRGVLARARVIEETRKSLWDRGFIEIPTPVLQPMYGGASAKPFTTRVEAIDEEWYLRISPELYLKRYIIAGLSKVFEIGPQFRNEDVDPTHNPEFFSVEAYQAYADYFDMMDLLEELVEHLALRVSGSTTIMYCGQQIKLSRPWRRITLDEALREYAGLDVGSLRDDEIKDLLSERGVKLPVYNRGLAIVKLFEKLVERQLVQPTIVYDYPEESTPLCRPHRSKQGYVERFEAFVAGFEIANSYTELNDPDLQRRFFEREQQLLPKEEAHPLDWDFIECMKLGMPPTGGIGAGLDRLAMLLANVRSIRHVIPFPIVKSKKELYNKQQILMNEVGNRVEGM